jgi:5-methylcytosine-specific restriction endonuclease McrA
LQKPLGEFYASEKYDGGYSPYCKVCYLSLNKQYRNPERDRPARLKRYLANKDHFCRLSRANCDRAKGLDPAKFRAKKFFDVRRVGVAPDVTRPYLAGLFRTITHCQCCEKPLTLEYEKRTSRKYRSNPAAPSVDRVNNRKGYTRSNIAIICWECNFRKTDLTLDDLDRLRAYILEYGDNNVV